MFGLSRQNKIIKDDQDEQDREAKETAQQHRDRRKVSGERVSVQCTFSLANPDPFKYSRIHTRGLMILNVRGCCVYPKETLSFEDTKKAFPEASVLNVKRMVLTGSDGKAFDIPNLSIRRVRLTKDEHGDGIILRFVNLSDEQLDTLVAITKRYSETD